jgi:chromosome segregation ATPase
MKELKLFENWAKGVETNYLIEADSEKKKSSRVMNTGIQSLAQRQYPDLDPQEAIITYMGQKLSDMETKDTEQIKLINRQSQETNKLMNTVQDIRSAYDELERDSQSVEQELDQIRGGAERAKSGQEQNTIDAREIKELLNTVEALKKNPDIDMKEYSDLVDSIKDLKDSNVNKKDYEELKRQIQQTKSSSEPELKTIHADIDRLKQEYGNKIAGAKKTRDELESLLKNDPNLLKGNPFIQTLDTEINNVTDKINQTNSKIKNIPSLPENLPDDEELKYLQGARMKIDHLRQRLKVNDRKDDEQTQTINDQHDSINKLTLDSQKIAQVVSNLAAQLDIDAKSVISDKNNVAESTSTIGLPTAYLNDIDELAERILGTQYGKYLK